MTRRGALLPLLAIVVAACGAAPPDSPRDGTPAATPSGVPSPDPAITPQPSASSAGQVGRPFVASDILEAMRLSRRPGGVPDELQTEAIAWAIADEIWTLGGAPWTSIVVGGSCGPTECTLEVSGAPAEAVAEDLWVFTITPASGAVAVASTVLRGMSPSLLDRADGVVRNSPSAPASEAILTSGRWLPPPDDGELILSYRTGAEIGACGVDYTVDVDGGTVIDESIVSC